MAGLKDIPPLFALALAASLFGCGKSGQDSDPAQSPRPRAIFRFSALKPERFIPPLPPAPDARVEANAGLVMNDSGLAIVKESEGLRLTAYAIGDQWLIGYGHAAGAQPGMKISKAEAERLLLQDIRRAEDAVRRLVTAPVNENEFAALVSLAYNLGEGGFSRTLVLERVNADDRAGAADAFRHLVTTMIAGERVTLASLERRRAAERALFLRPPLRA